MFFSRNPTSYRLDGTPPWCLTTDPDERWDWCTVPSCPEVVVALWHSVNDWTIQGVTVFAFELKFIFTSDYFDRLSGAVG